jgi:cell division protein FtsB
MTTESSKSNPLEIEPENPEAASTPPQSEEPTPALEEPTPALEEPTPALEEPTPELEQPAPELEQTAEQPSPVQTEKKPEMGRFKRFLRTTLIVLAAVLVVFLAGFLTNHYVRYNPMESNLTAQLTQSQDDLTQANQTVSDLQSQMDDLTTELTAANDSNTALEQDKENLQSNLESANAHIELLAALVEINTAHIELKNDNIAGAKVALSNTATRLENLTPVVETVDTALAANMLTRLNLILTSMDTDSVTAQADLGLLAINLQSVETLLFSAE